MAHNCSQCFHIFIFRYSIVSIIRRILKLRSLLLRSRNPEDRKTEYNGSPPRIASEQLLTIFLLSNFPPDNPEVLWFPTTVQLSWDWIWPSLKLLHGTLQNNPCLCPPETNAKWTASPLLHTPSQNTSGNPIGRSTGTIILHTLTPDFLREAFWCIMIQSSYIFRKTWMLRSLVEQQDDDRTIDLRNLQDWCRRRPT